MAATAKANGRNEHNDEMEVAAKCEKRKHCGFVAVHVGMLHEV